MGKKEALDFLHWIWKNRPKYVLFVLLLWAEFGIFALFYVAHVTGFFAIATNHEINDIKLSYVNVAITISIP